MSLIKRAFDGNEKRGADPTLNWGSSYIPTNGQSGLTAAGLSLTDDAALSISSVYTAVSILSDSVSTLPLRTYKTGDISKTIQSPPMLIDNPWPEGTLQDWLSQVMFSLAMRGNFYGQIVDRDKNGYATMIRPLHPDQVTARRVQGRRTYWFDGVRQNTDDVLHIPNILSPGAFIGINPVEYMRQSWALMLAAEKYGAGFFQNSALPQGVIEVGEDLTEEEAIELARAWKMSHGGLGNAGMPAVLTGGATFKVLSLKPEDTMFLATKSFQREEIAAFFRIPAHLMGQQDRALALGTPISTPLGWTTMGELQPGDVIFGSEGQPTIVLGVSPIQTDHVCYAVNVNNDSIIADAGHLWTVRNSSDEILTLTTQAMVDDGGIFSVPVVGTDLKQWTEITSIHETDSVPVRCIAVSDENQLFLAGSSMTPTHNTSSWGTGVEQMEIGFVINTLRPYLNKIESYLSRLLPPQIQTRFDIRGRLRGDQGQRFAGYTMAVNNGYMNLDEIRDLEDLAPLPNGQGQTYWRPLNMGPIEKIMDGSLVPSGSGGMGGGTDQSPTAPPKGVVSK